MNIRERSKEFGILRAIGSSNRQIVKFLSLEVLMYAGIAGFIGEVLAYNRSMLHIIKSVPYKVEFHSFGDSLEFSFKLANKRKLNLSKSENNEKKV